MKKCLLLPHPEKEKVAGIRGLSKAQGFLAGDLLRVMEKIQARQGC